MKSFPLFPKHGFCNRRVVFFDLTLAFLTFYQRIHHHLVGTIVIFFQRIRSSNSRFFSCKTVQCLQPGIRIPWQTRFRCFLRGPRSRRSGRVALRFQVHIPRLWVVVAVGLLFRFLGGNLRKPPIFLSHEWPFGRGKLPYLGDLLTMVVNHLLAGMILQVIQSDTKPYWFLGSINRWLGNRMHCFLQICPADSTIKN